MLKNALKLGTLLTKSEAKKIVAGRGCDPGYVMCPDGSCVPMGADCNGGGGGACIDVTCITDTMAFHMGLYSYCPSELTDTVCAPDDSVRCVVVSC